MTCYTTHQICERVGGRLDGSRDLKITGVEQLDRAVAGQMTFIRTRQFAEQWPASRATAALVQEDVDLAPGPGRALVRVPEADLAVAIVLELFAPSVPAPPPGVDARAIVDPQARLGAGVAVGPLSVIGPRVRIGENTVIHSNVTVFDDSVIGAGCVLWPGVVIRERCVVGDGCILHPNVVIGADGFGYRPGPDGRSLVKIPQIGTVVLGRDVELGAGTCVDRGKFAETSIGDGTKIDNLCQIAHNCRIGRCVVIAAQVAVGGSVTIGDGVMIGGGASMREQVTIGAGARLGGLSGLISDLPAGETWHGNPAHNARAVFREYSLIQRLPELFRRLRKLDRSTTQE